MSCERGMMHSNVVTQTPEMKRIHPPQNGFYCYFSERTTKHQTTRNRRSRNSRKVIKAVAQFIWRSRFFLTYIAHTHDQNAKFTFLTRFYFILLLFFSCFFRFCNDFTVCSLLLFWKCHSHYDSNRFSVYPFKYYKTWWSHELINEKQTNWEKKWSTRKWKTHCGDHDATITHKNRIGCNKYTRKNKSKTTQNTQKEAMEKNTFWKRHRYTNAHIKQTNESDYSAERNVSTKSRLTLNVYQQSMTDIMNESAVVVQL